jgi:LacI family transcriptional regulator
LDAFKKNLARVGLEYSDELVVFGENTSEGGYDAFMKLASRIQAPISVICCSDNIAIGVIKAARECRLDVPDDVSILGCDDIEMLSYLETPLSSVRQARFTIGARAAQQLINMIGSSFYNECFHLVLQPELVVRASTTPSKRQ